MSDSWAVLDEVLRERHRQDARFGQQNHDPFLWLTILGEEYGEACRGAYEAEITTSLRAELIQVAAVACAFVESIDRNYREEIA